MGHQPPRTRRPNPSIVNRKPPPTEPDRWLDRWWIDVLFVLLLIALGVLFSVTT